MAIHRDTFPNLDTEVLLAYVGMETDLIFTRGVDLLGFASYPLLQTIEGRELLEGYLKDMIALAKDTGTGVILESPTWVANRDRGAAIGFSPETLKQLNQAAVTFMAEVREANGDVPTVISANLGPRDDAYDPSEQ